MVLSMVLSWCMCSAQSKKMKIQSLKDLLSCNPICGHLRSGLKFNIKVNAANLGKQTAWVLLSLFPSGMWIGEERKILSKVMTRINCFLFPYSSILFCVSEWALHVLQQNDQQNSDSVMLENAAFVCLGWWSVEQYWQETSQIGRCCITLK